MLFVQVCSCKNTSKQHAVLNEAWFSSTESSIVLHMFIQVIYVFSLSISSPAVADGVMMRDFHQERVRLTRQLRPRGVDFGQLKIFTAIERKQVANQELELRNIQFFWRMFQYKLVVDSIARDLSSTWLHGGWLQSNLPVPTTQTRN